MKQVRNIKCYKSIFMINKNKTCLSPIKTGFVVHMLTVTQSNKIKSLFDCLDELYMDTETTKYAAIFSKNNSLISIGRFGFSDLLQSKFKAKLNDKNITVEQKYKLEQLIQDHLYYKSINDENPIQVGQSAIKNAVYNLLTDKTDFTDYKIEVSLSPCLLCYIGLLSCGFQPKNILVNAQALEKQPISTQCNDGKTNMMWDKC